MKKTYALTFALLLLLATGFVPTAAAQEPVPDWPGLYDPETLLNFNLEMTEANWHTIVNDLTFDIEVPALFSAEGEAPILVSVRRKAATKLGQDKVSLKVDINEYTDDDGCDSDHGFPGATCVDKWHGVKKLSLENGDDNNVVTEGLAWYLHTVAADSDLNYHSGHAAWVTVTVNGDSKGVYVNVEQPDKQYLKNHDLWEGSDDTWLYKYSDIDSPEIKVGPEDELRDKRTPAKSLASHTPRDASLPAPARMGFWRVFGHFPLAKLTVRPAQHDIFRLFGLANKGQESVTWGHDLSCSHVTDKL
ncbi:MAG: CotH kinase family protein [Chloroflexota bacterium]|nr:CotH kinase family protein [Chloroflexota bacterium]